MAHLDAAFRQAVAAFDEAQKNDTLPTTSPVKATASSTRLGNSLPRPEPPVVPPELRTPRRIGRSRPQESVVQEETLGVGGVSAASKQPVQTPPRLWETRGQADSLSQKQTNDSTKMDAGVTTTGNGGKQMPFGAWKPAKGAAEALDATAGAQWFPWRASDAATDRAAQKGPSKVSFASEVELSARRDQLGSRQAKEKTGSKADSTMPKSNPPAYPAWGPPIKPLVVGSAAEGSSGWIPAPKGDFKAQPASFFGVPGAHSKATAQDGAAASQPPASQAAPFAAGAGQPRDNISTPMHNLPGGKDASKKTGVRTRSAAKQFMTPLERLASDDNSQGSPMDTSPIGFTPVNIFTSQTATRLNGRLQQDMDGRAEEQPGQKDYSTSAGWESALRRGKEIREQAAESSDSYGGSSSGWSETEEVDIDLEDDVARGGIPSKFSYRSKANPAGKLAGKFKYKPKNTPPRDKSSENPKPQWSNIEPSFVRPAGLSKAMPEEDADGLVNDFATINAQSPSKRASPSFEKQFAHKVFLGSPGRTPFKADHVHDLDPDPEVEEIIDLVSSDDEVLPQTKAKASKEHQSSSIPVRPPPGLEATQQATTEALQSTKDPIWESYRPKGSSGGGLGASTTAQPKGVQRSAAPVDLTAASPKASQPSTASAARPSMDQFWKKLSERGFSNPPVDPRQSSSDAPAGAPAPPGQTSVGAPGTQNPFTKWKDVTSPPKDDTQASQPATPRSGSASKGAKVRTRVRVTPRKTGARMASKAALATEASNVPASTASPEQTSDAEAGAKWAAYAAEISKQNAADKAGTSTAKDANEDTPNTDVWSSARDFKPFVGGKATPPSRSSKKSAEDDPASSFDAWGTADFKPLDDDQETSGVFQTPAASARPSTPGPAPMSGVKYGATNRSPFFKQTTGDPGGAARATHDSASADRYESSSEASKPSAEQGIPFRSWRSAVQSENPQDNQGKAGKTTTKRAFDPKPAGNIQNSSAAPWTAENVLGGALNAGKAGGLSMGSNSAERTKVSARRKQSATKGSTGLQNIPPNAQTQGGLASGGSRVPDPADVHKRRVQEQAKALHKKGNEHHTKKEYEKAVVMYKKAITELHSIGLVKESAILYNNLAATSIQTSRPAAALHYCNQALQADPGLLKAHIRAGNAHWKLGDLDAAAKRYEYVCSHPEPPPEALTRREELKLFVQAKAKAFDSLRANVNPDGAQENLMAGPLVLIQSAPACQEILSLWAHSLLQLDRPVEASQMAKSHVHPGETSLPQPAWPVWVEAQAQFLQGNLKEAADGLEQQAAQLAEGTLSSSQTAQLLTLDGSLLTREELTNAANSMRHLMAVKEQGNSAQTNGSHKEALQLYTQAIALCMNASPQFAAILHANRAAANQALGNYAEAIADCLQSKALKPQYAKAASRLATLYTECGFYAAAENVLGELEMILLSQGSSVVDVKRRSMEARMKASTRRFGDYYKLLGLKQTCDADEVKKVYKKLALRFHPDKALQNCKFSLSVSPSALNLVTRVQIESAIREAAKSLFQQIGAAHTSLVDPQKRREVDVELTAGAYSNMYAPHMYSNSMYHGAGFYQPQSFYRPTHNFPRRTDSHKTYRRPGANPHYRYSRRDSYESEGDEFPDTYSRY